MQECVDRQRYLYGPYMLGHHNLHPIAYAIPVTVVLSLAGMRILTAQGRELMAFLSSCLYLAIMLVGAAVGLYSTLLPSSANAAGDITVGKLYLARTRHTWDSPSAHLACCSLLDTSASATECFAVRFLRRRMGMVISRPNGAVLNQTSTAICDVRHSVRCHTTQRAEQ